MVEPVRPPSARSRFNFSRWAIAHPYLTLCFWIGVCVAGVLAFSSLKYALFPDITFPVVVVNASAPLKTALDTEQQLTKPIEQALQGVNYTDLSSTTYPGRSVVNLRFQVGTDLQKSTRTVEAALQPIKLPDKADFNVLPINLNEAVVASYTLQSDAQTLETLSKTAKTEIIPSIAALPNVLRVDLLGVPLPATSNPIAAFQAAQKEKATLVRFNGKPALAFQVVKQSDANTLEVVRQVNQHIRQLRQKFPQINWAVASTQADYIRAATRATMSALFEAIALSVIVILPFLRSWRATVISALAIPTSLLGTFIVMAIYGFNLETITLLALAMVIGSLVDDAIVDVENVVRHIEKGESPRQASIRSTDEISLAVIATTAVAVAVFLPVGLMHGVVGQFFKPFGITISAALIISTLVARTLTPALAAIWLKPRPVDLDEDNWNTDAVNKLENNPENDFQPNSLLSNYRKLLDWALNHRYLVITLALLSFLGGLALIPLIPQGFIPKLDRGEFNIVYNTPLPDADQIRVQMQQQAQQARQQAQQAQGVSQAQGTSQVQGAIQAQANQASQAQANQANPAQTNQAQANQTRGNLTQANPTQLNQAQLNQTSQLAPGQRPSNPSPSSPSPSSQRPDQNRPAGQGNSAASLGFNPLGASLQVAEQMNAVILNSPEVNKVLTIVGTRQGELNKGSLYVKLNPDRSQTTSELQDQFRRDLPKLPGVSVSVEDIQFVDTGGEKPVQIRIQGEDLKLLNQTAKTIQTRLAKIPGLEDVTVTGAPDKNDAVVEIHRNSGTRIVTISANLGTGLNLGEATDRALAETKAVLPSSISLKLGGDSARAREILTTFGITLLLSLLCIVLVLWLLFRSLTDTIVIFLSLPLSVVGAMLGLLLSESDFGMISLLGIVFLLGLTNKNAILIVDYINQRRQAGMSRRDAILDAVPVRLRPILMTTASTILGMLPLALGEKAGLELRAPMAVAIMGGLITSTLLSLLVIPVIYEMLDDWRSTLRGTLGLKQNR